MRHQRDCKLRQLTSIGSMRRSPNPESSSTTPASGTTPGKEQLALPASENVSFPYDIEEVNEPAEKVTETVR